MKFNPNYKTKDGWFEVELDISKLTDEKPPKQDYYQSDEITIHKIRVYNTHTNRHSEKSIYRDNKGYYFKGKNSYWHRTPSSKYYVNELLKEEVENADKMSRLTIKNGNYYCSPDSETSLKPVYDKLGKLEDIEEQLGCPLEVVFKALMNGAYLEIIGNKVSDNDMVYHKNISINSSEIILQRTNNSCIVIHRKLTDYKKTWWLSETKEE